MVNVIFESIFYNWKWFFGVSLLLNIEYFIVQASFKRSKIKLVLWFFFIFLALLPNSTVLILVVNIKINSLSTASFKIVRKLTNKSITFPSA